MRSASATLPASSPPESMNGTAGSRLSSSRQSNGLPSPPGRVASRGARASKMQPVGDLVVEPDRREVGALGDRQRLHDRQAEARAHRDHAVRRLLAVQLQHVGLQRLDDCLERRVVGVDRERDLLRAPAHALAERARGLVAEIARRRREEHEADHVGARVERYVERLGRLQAADFDHNGHRRRSLSAAVLPRRRRFVSPFPSF